MNPTLDITPTGAPSPFKRLAVVEAKLLLREPIPLFWGIAFPMLLLGVMGAFSGGPDPELGGLRLVAVYEPILVAFVTATFALQGLPTVLAGYRERGILRRLDTTPVGVHRVLAAQLTVNLAVAMTATVGIILVGRVAFGVALPGQPAGFLVAVLLAAAAMLALGLLIAALAPNGRVAGAAGSILFFPMMFFAGLWVPQATMPSALRHFSHFTPLGAAVQSLQDSMGGHWPHSSDLATLAVYTIVFAMAATRFFRWD
ncbi:MAG: type transport system permease protein [Acidimicrobiaceae bacterium]|nr:type transport system permease protein [Acidimicrobiaceae bacterium]